MVTGRRKVLGMSYQTTSKKYDAHCAYLAKSIAHDGEVWQYLVIPCARRNEDNLSQMSELLTVCGIRDAEHGHS